MNKFFYILLAMVFTANASYAQMRVYGKVTDHKNVPIDVATIVLKDDQGNIITGCISDSLGCFNINNLELRTYTLHVSCIGYANYIKQLKADKDIYMDIMLNRQEFALGEVTVTAKTPLIRREIDRVVLNADKLNSVATNFIDVLKHTPGVLVQDDDISMLNKGKIIFLLNGREMNMDMKGLIAYLTAQSSENLKQIEVMTTPPAKYSAEGSAGVINFVTNKQRNNFIGGNAANRLSVRKSVYDDASISLQYKQNKVEAYMNAGVGFGTMQSDSEKGIDYPSETWSTTNNMHKSNNYVVTTAGLEYLTTENSSLGAIFSYTDMQPDANSTAGTSVLHKETNQQLKQFETNTQSNVNYNRYNANLHYTLANIGRKGGELSVNADYLNYAINDKVSLNTLHDESLSYKCRPENTIEIYQAKADMEMPITKGAVSFGVSYSQSKTDNQTRYEQISTDQNLDDHFIYREYILAAYGDLRIKCSDYWDFKLGVRGEYGKLDGNSIKMIQRTIKHQFDLFPTAYLNYKLNEDKTFYLSMSSRINRPSYVDINPFVTYTDAYTKTEGNPNLLPEKSYTAELGYIQGNFSVSTSAMWKNHVVASYITMDDSHKLTTITSDNIMKKQIYSIDMSYYFDRLSWLDSSIEGSVYTIISRPMTGYDFKKTTNTSIFIYMNNNIYLNRSKTLMATLWGQYQSKEKDIVGESKSRYRVDLGLKYLLLNKRLSVGVEYQNMLASSAKSVIFNQDAIHTFKSSPYRVLKVSLSYRFGKELKIKQNAFGIGSERL